MRIQNRHVVTHETYASVNLVMRIKAAFDLKEAVRLAVDIVKVDPQAFQKS